MQYYSLSRVTSHQTVGFTYKAGLQFTFLILCNIKWVNFCNLWSLSYTKPSSGPFILSRVIIINEHVERTEKVCVKNSEDDLIAEGVCQLGNAEHRIVITFRVVCVEMKSKLNGLERTTWNHKSACVDNFLFSFFRRVHFFASLLVVFALRMFVDVNAVLFIFLQTDYYLTRTLTRFVPVRK